MSSRSGKPVPQHTPQPGATPARPTRDADLLATILDDLVKVPGTNIGIGLDGILGLVPGIGDSVTTTVASAILIDAARRRVPIHILVRMALNLVIDTALGWVPLIGDAADFAHRANRKNYRLLREAIDTGKVVDDSYRAYMVKAVGVVASVLLLMVASAIFALWAVITILMHVLG